MKQQIREAVRLKCNGLCAYTGRPLEDDWQVDHVSPQYYFDLGICEGNKNDSENLLPTIRIINHYKRGLDLEQFRKYMLTFHERIAKLPKKPIVEKSIKRKMYMLTIAVLFGITSDKPFDGKFYFEKLSNNKSYPNHSQ